MNRVRSLLLFSCWLWCLHAAAVGGYFQQGVSYRIRVRLDDRRSELHGHVLIDYTNRSDSTLREIYLHTWPNAYRNERTGLARELFANANPVLALARPEARGYMDSLDFRCNSQEVAWSAVEGKEDIVRIYLKEPLTPGATVAIESPFRVKIPAADISRLGTADGRYYITQWYPKPAVFDRSGWHALTYQNWGEFYGEFGRYEVEITLPETYWLAATGTLRNEAEYQRRLQADSVTRAGGKVSEAGLRPSETSQGLTLRFEADSVHDFAFFAAKDYQVACDRTPGKPEIWSFYLDQHRPQWNAANVLLRQALDSMTRWVGDYPYAQLTAVDVDHIAGRDMEYPTLVAIGTCNANEFVQTVYHEVAHQWFYGMLGNNERDHAWMDEGWTSYFEYRLYLNSFRLVEQGTEPLLSRWLYQGDAPEDVLPSYRIQYLHHASRGMDVPAGRTALYYDESDYYTATYLKPTLGIVWMEDALGKAALDSAIRAYFRAWKFRHPGPDDLQTILEATSGKQLGWFFQDWMHTTAKADYKLKVRASGTAPLHVTVFNKGGIDGPVSLAAYRDGRVIGQRSVQSEEFNRPFDWQIEGADRLLLDPAQYVPEVNRRNNEVRMRGLLRSVEPVRVQFFLGHEPPQRTTLGVFPAIGWNTNNGLLAGGGLHNLNFEEKPFEWLAMPLVGMQDKELNGGGFIRYHFYPHAGRLRRIRVQSGWSRYAYATDSYADTSGKVLSDGPLHVIKADHSIQLKFARDSRDRVESQVRLSAIQLFRNLPYAYAYAPSTRNDLFLIAGYERTTAFPKASHLRVEGQWHRDMAKLTLTDEWLLPYRNPRKGMRIRLFAGYVSIQNTAVAGQDFRLRLSGFDGSDDYLFRDVFPGRNESEGVFSRQYVLTEGGFTTPVRFFGKSEGWMLTGRASTTLPGKLPFRLYLAAGSFEDINEFRPEFGKVSFEGGVELPILNDIFVVYLPAVYSKDIRDALDRLELSTAETIRFELRLRDLNPIELARKYLH